jgi:hypothetical protein
MWYRFVLLPWWAHFLVFGPLFVLVTTLPLLTGGSRAPSALWGIAAVLGVLLGLVMVFAMRRGARPLRENLVGVAQSDYPKVAKALTDGPVPSDPAVRHAALLIARRSGEKLERRKPVMIGLLLVCAVLQAVSILDSHSSAGVTAWRLLSLAMFAGLSVCYWLYPKLLLARARLLSAPEGAPAPSHPPVADPHWSDRAAPPRVGPHL